MRCCNVCPLAALRAGRGAGGRDRGCAAAVFSFYAAPSAHLFGSLRRLCVIDAPVHLPDELLLRVAASGIIAGL